jgi:hypothetical protein
MPLVAPIGSQWEREKLDLPSDGINLIPAARESPQRFAGFEKTIYDRSIRHGSNGCLPSGNHRSKGRNF